VLTFKAHTKPIYGLAFSPDGTQIATTAGDAACVWNLDGPTEVRKFPNEHYSCSIAFSPNGRFLARGGNRPRVWNLETGKALVAHERWAATVAFSPDGTEVAAFGSDELLARWPLPGGKQLSGGWGGSRSEHRNQRFPAGAMAYSPDGKIIATAYAVDTGKRFDSHILLWDRKTGRSRGELVADFKFAHPTAIAYSPDGAVIAGIYGPVLGVVDVTSGKKVAALKPGKKHFKGLAFTPDGKRLIAVNTDAAVRVYDTATWKETAGYEWQIGKLTAVTVAPDGLRAACGSDRGRVVVWDLDV
jgi:WD40 repeat protein